MAIKRDAPLLKARKYMVSILNTNENTAPRRKASFKEQFSRLSNKGISAIQAKNPIGNAGMDNASSKPDNEGSPTLPLKSSSKNFI